MLVNNESWKLPLPCAAGPALLGEAAMRRKDLRGRWGEDPSPAQDTHLSLPVDFAPSLNWAGPNAPSRSSRYLAIHKSCS